MRPFLLIQFVAVVVAALVSKLFDRKLSAKLSAVSDHLRKLSVSGHQVDRLQVHGDDEVDRLADQFNKLLDRAESAQVDLIESQRLRAFNELATQVAHDIRSPLAALVAFEKSQLEISEERRLMLRAAVNRINDIANNLLTQVRAQTVAETSELTCELIPATVSSLITEKRMQYRARIGVQLDLEVLPSAYGLFAKVSSTELKRVLSNLIDNAFEAIEEAGRVRVVVMGSDEQVVVAVQDDGAGVPEHILKQIGQRGITAKDQGSGLGLYHAFKTVRAWRGDVRVTSRRGEGTKVELILVRGGAPDWFCPGLPMDVSQVVVVDDDVSIHNVWRERFSIVKDPHRIPDIVNLATIDELNQYLAANGGENALFLIDYEFLGSEETGLTAIERLNLGDRGILVTSRFEDKAVQAQCLALGVRIVPKSMALYVPLQTNAAEERADVILIDDDELVHSTWRLAAQNSGRRLWTFREPEPFLRALANVGRSTPIYVDHRLGGGRSGLDLVKEVMRRGFRNVRLATGDFALFENLSDVTVVGKSPAAELS